MSERVRIEYFEKLDVRRILSEYWRQEQLCEDRKSVPHHDHVEDLVNRIGEIYEKALARGAATHVG